MNLIKYQLKMLTWMGYVAFNWILVTELDGMTLLKITQTYGVQMKKFEVWEPKVDFSLYYINASIGVNIYWSSMTNYNPAFWTAYVVNYSLIL
jgi:hypothetical protein